MHELSIVEALLEAVRAAGRDHPAAAVRTVRVRVGALRQVVPALLEFWFAAATQDTPWAEARLAIEEVPARARCGACGEAFAVEENWFECPKCGAAGGQLVSGQELALVGLELAESQTESWLVATGGPNANHPADHQIRCGT